MTDNTQSKEAEALGYVKGEIMKLARHYSPRSEEYHYKYYVNSLDFKPCTKQEYKEILSNIDRNQKNHKHSRTNFLKATNYLINLGLIENTFATTGDVLIIPNKYTIYFDDTYGVISDLVATDEKPPVENYLDYFRNMKEALRQQLVKIVVFLQTYRALQCIPNINEMLENDHNIETIESFMGYAHKKLMMRACMPAKYINTKFDYKDYVRNLNTFGKVVLEHIQKDIASGRKIPSRLANNMDIVAEHVKSNPPAFLKHMTPETEAVIEKILERTIVLENKSKHKVQEIKYTGDNMKLSKELKELLNKGYVIKEF